MATEAPRNSAQGSGDGQGSVVSSWSCFNCRRRKARCNRQSPCTFCSKAGVECSYPFTGRMPTRQHNPATASVTSVQARPPRKRSELQVQELLERLRQLESVVDEMKGQDKKDTPHYNRSGHAKDPNSGAEADSTTGGSETTESCSDLSHQLSKTFGSLHVCEGGTLYTSNGFWAALHGEVC